VINRHCSSRYVVYSFIITYVLALGYIIMQVFLAWKASVITATLDAKEAASVIDMIKTFPSVTYIRILGVIITAWGGIEGIGSMLKTRSAPVGMKHKIPPHRISLLWKLAVSTFILSVTSTVCYFLINFTFGIPISAEAYGLQDVALSFGSSVTGIALSAKVYKVTENITTAKPTAEKQTDTKKASTKKAAATTKK
jgi:hypothetical protein